MGRDIVMPGNGLGMPGIEASSRAGETARESKIPNTEYPTGRRADEARVAYEDW